MAISSLVVDTLAAETSQVAADLAKIPGVEVHEQHESKLVVTIEAESADASHDIANGFYDLPGVLTVALVYVNFEDEA